MIVVKKSISKFKNKGLGLERLLINTFAQQKYQKIGLIEKYPTPIQVLKNDEDFITKAYFKRTSSLDFVGIFNGKHIEIEAKTTQNPNIFSLHNILPHQLARIEKLVELGSLVYLVIEFKCENLYFLLPGITLLKYKERSIKNITLDEIKKVSVELHMKANLTLDIFENL